MDQEQRDLIVAEMPHGDLLEYATTLERMMTDKSDSSRTLKIAKRIAPLVQLFEVTKPFSDALHAVYPPAGMIIGGISFLLSASKRAVDYQEALNSFLESTVDLLAILEGFKSAIQLTKEGQIALAKIYGEIVQFVAHLSKSFGKRHFRHGLRIFARSQLNTFDADFQGVKQKIKIHVDNFQMAANFQSQVDSKKSHGKTHEKLDSLERDKRAQDARKQAEIRRDMLSWISLDNSYHLAQDQKLGERLKSTGNWLLNHKLFQAWKQAEKSRLLWIHGKAGSGKSHLAACVIDDIEKSCKTHRQSGDKETHALAYFYCSAKSTQHQDKRGDASSPTSQLAVLLLSSLLRQLYEQLPAEEDVDSILQNYKDRPSNRLGREKTKDGIRNILMKFTRTFIVVDGLDEWSGLPGGGFASLCEFIQSLTTLESKSIISVAIFSRPKQPILESTLCESTKVAVDDGSNADDINLFINKRTSDLMKASPASEQIKTELANRAGGMFLWASLVINDMKSKRTPKQMQQTLEKTPSDLEAAYSKSLQRIMAQEKSRRELGLNALLWVSNSLEPLIERELVEALSFQPGMKSIDNDDRVYGDMIISDCADLLVVRQGRYELLHSSLKDYLKKSGPSDSSLPEEMKTMQSQANALLGRRCLEYLELDEFQEVPVDTAEDFDRKLQIYPLLKHAALHWGDYLRLSYSTENPGDYLLECRSLQNPKTRDFATQIRRACWAGCDKKTLFPCPGKVQPLHLIARFGLEKLLPQFPEISLQIYMADGHGDYPIDCAIERAIFEWILDHRGTAQRSIDGECTENRPNAPWYNEPPIIDAARNDWDDLVLRLIKEGCDKDERQGDAETALHAAALAGSFASAKVLIKAGADINSTDGIGDTPLMNALLNSHHGIFKLLLEAGADAALRRSNGRTVLHQLVFKEGEEWTSLIPLVCTQAANLETTEKDGLTPLLMAAFADNASALQALLDEGANISATDAYDRNILHICAIVGKYRAMDLLLKSRELLRASLSELAPGRDRWGQSPLHHAASHGQMQMVEFLLSSGLPLASMDFENTTGWWPVHIAANRGALKFVRALVNLDAENANRRTGDSGLTPLFLAAGAGYTHLVKYLLSVGADTDLLSTEVSQTPLLAAIMQHRTATALTLLSHGANPCLPDHEGDAALEYAAVYGNQVLIRFLLDSVSKYPISHDQRLRALNHAAQNQHVEVVDLLLLPPVDSGFLSAIEKSSCGKNAILGGSIEIWQSLLTACPPLLPAIGDSGENWLHYAAQEGHTHLIGYLCKEGLDLELEDKCRQTPLFWAATSGSTGALMALCREGANISHIDFFGRTALHWAAIYGFRDIVQILLHRGANPYTRDQAGLAAFGYLSAAQLVAVTGQHAINPFPRAADDCQSRSAIASISRRVLQLEFSDNKRPRMRCLDAVYDILMKLRAFREAFWVLRDASISGVPCSICGTTCEGPWSHCRECFERFVCSGCRKSFFTRAGISQLPRRISGIHNQEQKLRPVLRALFHASTFGESTVLETLEMHTVFAMTFARLSDLYRAWRVAHRLTGHIDARFQNMPGWRMISILEDLRSHPGNMQIGQRNDDPESVSDPIPSLDNMTAIRHQLRDLFWYHPPGREFRGFRCTGHEYLDVPTVEELPEEEKGFFDEESNLTSSFFEMLEKKYGAGEDTDILSESGAPEPSTTVDSNPKDSPTSPAEATFSSPQKSIPDSLSGVPQDNSSDVFEDALEEQSRHSQQGAGEDLEGSPDDDDASSDISVSTELGEKLLIFEDSEPGRIWRECNPNFDFDQFRDTLLDRMKGLGPGDGGREIRRKKTVLETAWALAQALAFEDEAHFPTLAEYLD